MRKIEYSWKKEVLALKVVNESLKLPGVKVNRNAF